MCIRDRYKFIKSGASSASEIVASMIEHGNIEIKLTKSEATLMLAGIMLDTVSYTHLDVYKRQDERTAQLAVDLLDVHHYSAVSYTHLDVYKRQLPGGKQVPHRIFHMNVLSFFLISSRYPYMTSLYFSALVLTFSAISVCIFLFFASYCLIAGSRFIDLFHCIRCV